MDVAGPEMVTKRQDKICKLLCELGREEILKFFKPDSCIASTKVAIKVLQHFRIGARPQAVMLEIMNAKFMELFDQKGGYPQSKDESQAWLAAGAHLIVIDESGLGHIVAIVMDALLIDLSIDQAHRPHKGVVMTPAAGILPSMASFVTNGVCYEASNCRISYCPIDNQVFRTSNDWRKGRRTDSVCKAIIRNIQRRL